MFKIAISPLKAERPAGEESASSVRKVLDEGFIAIIVVNGAFGAVGHASSLDYCRRWGI